MTATVPATIDPVCLALLVDPRPTRAVDALRMALVVLTAAGHLAIDGTPGGDTFVRVQRAPGSATPAHIVGVYRVLRDAASSGRLSRAVARAALAKAFGPRFHCYVETMVAPALIARGLLHVETTRLLWVFTSRRLRRTAMGDTAARRLARRLADLDTLPQLVDRDPVRAVKLARAAGPLLLLSPAARAMIPRLHALAPAALGASAFALIEERDAEWLELFEHADLVMSIEFDSLLDAIEAIAGFGEDGGSGSSSDGDGGGDGGGGDGGGGGGD